jgi:uncharacterized repeat protein (TIGR03806 family)
MQEARKRWLVAWAGCALIAVGVGLGGPAGPAGAAPPAARAPGTIKIEGNPEGLPAYVVVKAFPKLHFERPVWIGSPPDGSNMMWVLEQDGRILVFENRRDVKKATVALDIRKQVYRAHNEEGLQALAFHPDFKHNRVVYLSYSASDPRRLVVSRFECSSTRRRVMPRSEKLVLRQREPYGNHNGGCLAFGPDDKLYVSLGDGGSHGDPNDNAQDLRTWLGSILRIDVWHRKVGFDVPPDNPFVGVQHVRPEIWAFGLQNPRRFSFDRVTGELWAGDVGNDKYQEIDRIEKGGNYGWSYREGTHEFKPGRARDILKEPVISLGDDVARRITGGFVYRGKRMPGLVGAYLYGDIANGNVWALRTDGKEVKENKLIGRGRGVTSFGEDQDGEVYFTCYDGYVYTFAPWTGQETEPRFPRRLSDTGLFRDTHALEPDPALIPYEVNVPLWADGAFKQRFVMLPGMEKIHVRADGSFEFPVGTIFVKTFYLGNKDRGPLPGTRLETRLFTRRPQGWAGYTYVWDDLQQDAHLLDGRLVQPRGVGSELTWTFPSRSDCMSCHTQVGNRVLGFRAEQLDRPEVVDGQGGNQLARLARLTVFDAKVDPGGSAWPDWGNPGKRETDAVRAYLAANCSMCHQPNGPGNARIDLRYGTRLQDAGLLDQRPGQWDLGVYNGRLVAPGEPQRSLLFVRLQRTDGKGMPPLAHSLVDKKAVERIGAWIRQLR